MPRSNEKNSSPRDLPISLRAIETILRFLKRKGKKLSSMRSVSRNTDLSMRVVKNVLLQLEKFNQVERVIEQNNILPKWRITPFGIRVIKEADGNKIKGRKKSEQELLSGIIIPEELKPLRENALNMRSEIISEIENIKTDLSKLLGPILNINDPPFENLMGFLIRKLSFLKQDLSTRSFNPLTRYKVKKINEDKKKVSKKEEKAIFTEIYFINSIILNELKVVSSITIRLTRFIDNDAFSSAYSLARELREEIRVLDQLIKEREKIGVNSHIYNMEEIEQIEDNVLQIGFIEKLLITPMTEKERKQAIEEVVLKYLNKLNSGDVELEEHTYEVKENMPLYVFHQLILDQKPEIRFSIEELESVINSLAEQAYIPGIKTIEYQNKSLKFVQLKAYDLSDEEIKMVSEALDLKTFTLNEMKKKTGWSADKTRDILNNLTNLGLFKHSDSFLYGEQWYLVKG